MFNKLNFEKGRSCVTHVQHRKRDVRQETYHQIFEIFVFLIFILFFSCIYNIFHIYIRIKNASVFIYFNLLYPGKRKTLKHSIYHVSFLVTYTYIQLDTRISVCAH